MSCEVVDKFSIMRRSRIISQAGSTSRLGLGRVQLPARGGPTMLLNNTFFENRGGQVRDPCPTLDSSMHIQREQGYPDPLTFRSEKIDRLFGQRKSVFGVSDQVRHKPGCTVKEAWQMLDILGLERKYIV